MTEALIIRVNGSQSAAINWLIWSQAEHEIIASGTLDGANELDALTDKAQGRECVLLLPASQAQLKRVTLPSKWGAKLQQALPFIIEDEIASDIDDVFIAVGQAHNIDDKHQLDVAIVDEQWMMQWLECLTSHGLAPSRVLPDAMLLPLPEEEHHVSAIELDGKWLFRGMPWHIAQVERPWLEMYLHAQKVETVRHYSPCDFTGVNLESNPDDVDLPLAIFARQLPHCTFNLLQGQYKVKKQGSPFWRTWRAPLIAASVALVLSLGFKATALYQINQQLIQSEADITAQYLSAFPGSKVRFHLIRNQIRNKLAAVDGGSESDFLALMESVVPVFSSVKAFHPESLRYDAKRQELRFRAVGKDFQSFNQVKTELEKRGLTVEQGGLNNEGNTVVGELKVRVQA